MDTKQLDSDYIAHTYARFPVEIVKGQGAVLTDSDGKQYLDFGSGIAVNTFGTADSEWIDAVTKQLSLFQHTSNLYYSKPCAELAKMLCERTGMKKVFFCNSGAEANECAIKLARAYGEKKGEGYYNIIALENSFHGRTLATLAATGQDVFHEKFTPLPKGFVFAEANNIDSLKQAAENNKCCAVMLETVQGEGGINVLTDEFVKAVRETAKKHDLLIIVDEVQTGNGRTGKLYSYMHYGFTPDVFTTAKGLGGGLPIGACVMGEKAQNLFAPGDNGSTFGGNPVVCAGAVNILSRLTDDFILKVEEKGEYFKKKLCEIDGVTEVSGRGLMLGFLSGKDSSQIIAEAREKGLLLLKAKNKVRLLPPLTVTKEQIDIAVKIISECV
ncbi:MAG: aspartate aminotransferase family protein [Acutalibacteraceae bacterium]